MSSWLPSGLTSLTGQITSFTKEVLSEGTEEIDDHVTELRVAKTRVKELELVCTTQRSELDRLKYLIDEFTVQLQSKELQLQSNANDYRTAIDLKEKEVKELKQRHAELCENFSNSTLLMPEQQLSRTHANAVGAQHNREFGSSLEDFHDVISSQHEINHLRNEVRRLEAEVGHWRRTSGAQSKMENGSSLIEHDSMTPHLESQISDLQRQLADEVDRHQHELSALQDAHRQTMSALKKTHKAAIDQLQQQLQQKLAPEQTQSATDHNKAELVDELQRNLNKANSEIEQLLNGRQADMSKQQLTNAEVDKLSAERDELTKQLSECKRHLFQQDQELNQLKSANFMDTCNSHAIHSNFMSSTPVASSRFRSRSDDLKTGFIDDSTSFEELSDQNHYLDEQVKTLQGQIEKYEQELEQFELVKSDWQMEKQALESVLKKLRDELREKEGELSIIQARKGPEHFVNTDSNQQAVINQDEQGLMETKQHNVNVREEVPQEDVDHFTPHEADSDEGSDDDEEDDDDIKVHAQKLDHQVELLASENAHLEADRDRLELDKEQLMSELEQQRHLVKMLELELKQLTESSISRQMELEAELLHRTNDVAHLKDQLNARESCISDLTVQLSSSHVVRSEDKAVLNEDSAEDPVEMVMSRRRSEMLEEELQIMKTEMKELELRKDALLKEEKRAVDTLLTEKRVLEESMEELDCSHQEAVNQIVKSRADVIRINEALKQQISSLEQQLTNAEKQKEELLRKADEDKERIRMLGEMETVLKRQLEDADVDIAAGKMELNTSIALVKQLEQATVSQAAELTRLQSAAGRLEQERQELTEELKHVQTGKGKEQLQFGSEEDVEQLKGELESTKMDVATLVKDLTSARNSLAAKQEEVQHLATEVEVLRVQNSTRPQNNPDFDAWKLQAVCSDLEQQLHKKTTSLQHIEKALKEAENAQNRMEEELTRVREEAKTAKEMQEEVESVAKLYEAEVERLTAVEDEHLSLVESFKNLQADAQQWMELASSHQDHVTGVMSTQENFEKRFVANVDEMSGDLENWKSLVDQLQKQVKSLESEISILNERNELKRFVEGHQMTDDSIDSQEEKTSNESDVKTCGDNLQNCEMNGKHVTMWSQSSTDDSIVRLKTTVSQQDDLIKTLNGKYASMLRLLEDRSMSMYGSTVLADVHQLETEVQVLRAEKEHMMSILNEKTREASSLKGEVHRLMSVVSAGKAALAKVQQDTQDMARNQEMSNIDMKKEAIKKLSQLVKDRDIEIEALKEKNSTLLQVLQSSSSEAATQQISALIEERDDLHRQITAYQNDRDQIINTLNVKHEESMSYYAEVERLSSLMTELTEHKERLDRNYSNLTVQYEDKQKSLVKALNELANYKQRLAESERCFSDAQERLRNENGGSGTLVDQSPVTFPPIVEIPNIAALKQSYETALAERDERLAELGRLSDKSEQLLYEKVQQLNSKEQELSQLMVRLHLAEANVSAKESELSSLRKQCENLTFQLQGLSDERTELTNESDKLHKRCESLVADVQLLRQTNNSMTVAVSNKDLEIATLKDKVRSLESAVQQRNDNAADAGVAETEHLMREIEMLKNQGQLLQQDRDNLYLAILQFQAENTELKNELGRVREKEQRLAKECDRLRGHLLVIEEGHTREALDAEEREKELRNRLAAVEERALSSSAAIVSARSDASRQVESLQIQLHAIADQRDNALLQLSNAHETITSYASSLTNLQMVLEQFQAERQHQQMVEIERYKRDLDVERAGSKHLRLQLDDLQRQLDEALEALAAAERLSEQLDKKEGMIAALREEVSLRENELSKSESELRKLTSSTEAKVDRVMVKSLFLGYFHAPASKRPEAINVIGHILSFTKEEMEEISRNSSGSESWIGGLFWKKSSSGPKPSQNQTQNLNHSFSEMFVNFLERESTPQPQLRLPAELMAQEQQDRRHHQQQQQQQKKTPVFNPFSTPVDSTVPLTLPTFSDSSQLSSLIAGANTSSHLLMGPISSSRLPIFAPATSRADTPVKGRDSSATSSGRSTPSGSGTVLRDILQQR